MKKLSFIAMAAFLAISATSCMGVDNFDEPQARYTARLIDKTTGLPLLTGQGEGAVRLWEMSYSLNPSPQDIPFKQDGTVSNYKLFAGTYDVQPRGAFWPMEKYEVKIGKRTAEDVIEVVPYLHINDFEMSLDNSGNQPMLTVSCTLSAPVTAGLPNIRLIRPFLSTNHFCSGSMCIGEYNNIKEYKTEINTAWADLKKNDDGTKTLPYSYTLPVKRGYHYWVRMGAYVDDEFHNFNYSEIKEIEIPLTKDGES